jgi:uncharacterized GH25 family protein
MLLAATAPVALAQNDAPPDNPGALAVKVLDGVNGQPIGAAKLQWVVSGGRPHLVGNWATDQAGMKTLPFPPSPGYEPKFWTTADGCVPAETAVQRNLTGDLPGVCTVRLERAVAVGGVVLNQAGEPIAGVEVFIELGRKAQTQDSSATSETHDDFHYEKTDANGRWTCHHVPKQLQAVRFRLIHPDYVTVILASETARQDKEMTVIVSESDLLAAKAVAIMQRGLAINGRVLDANEKPIEGAEVTGGDYPIWTPADGRFSWHNRPAGPLVLTAQAHDFAPQRKQFQVSRGMEEARFKLEPGHTLKVRVLDAKGRPVPGARIRAESAQDQSAGQWQWETDAQGRLVWDSAPAEDALYSIDHSGYEAVRSRPLKADGQEQPITLRKHLQISGRVVDFDTRTPLPSFRVEPGILHGDHHDWNPTLATNGQNGSYAITLPKREFPHLVRIEADGYYPEISPPFKDDDEEDVADFALKRGQPISGTVLSPGGQPLAKAQAALCLEDTVTVLAEAQFAGVERGRLSETDAQGRFLFQPRRGVKMIAAAHQQGYAEVSLDDFQESKVIRLAPWGRMTGVLHVGNSPGTNELVQLVRVGSFNPQFQINGFTALTDSQGRFTFERLPPGRHIIGRFIESQFSHGQAVTLKAGETTQIVLGEGGRTVTGRMVAADGRALDWEGGHHLALLRAGLPPLDIPKLPDGLAANAWLRAFWDSAQGRARQMSNLCYVLQFCSNNVFHAENVPAGVYECEIHYHEPAASANEPDHCLGIMRKQVVIPESPAGARDEPYELGSMTITLKPSSQ